MQPIVVFGAGKIARGFLGHLLSLSRLHFLFIDKDPAVVALLKEKRKYTIHVMGHGEKDHVVEGFEAYGSDELRQYLFVLAEADVVFTSVGGKNLSGIARVLALGFQMRLLMGIERPQNIISCENWVDLASHLRGEIERWLPPALGPAFRRSMGIVESVVLRSATNAEPERLRQDPLVVNVQDYWTLPVDGAAVVGTLPPIEGLVVERRFAGMLTRKLYTYNAANGTASYLGYLKGYRRIDEAVADDDILRVLNEVYEETSFALSREFGVPYDEEYAFSMSSLAKLRNRDIVDFIDRNARDPIRKLGARDRLVGPALLVLKHGSAPRGLATAIAAAIHYDNPADPVAVELRNMRLERGIDFILNSICGLEQYGDLKDLVYQKIDELKSRGLLRR